jgi:hypothetical protein
MFSSFSRYRKLPNVVTTDAKGRTLASKALRPLPSVSGTFQHTVTDGDRLDHVAFTYYQQPTKWWRINDANPEFLSPQELLGKEPVVTERFPVTFNGPQPPWAALTRSLNERAGIETVTVSETVQLAPESRTVGSKTVIVQAERFTRAVVVTYNLLAVTADTIRGLITAAGFVVGQAERVSRVGQPITIPQDSVE